MTLESNYTEVVQTSGYKILPKIVFKLTSEPWKFLEELTVGTKEQNQNAFLDRFGKLVVLFDQVIQEKEVYLVFEPQFEARVQEHLKNYLALGKTKMEKTDLKTVHIVGNVNTPGLTIPQRFGKLWLTEKTELDVPEISEEAYNALRLENNMTVQGIDFDQDMLLNTNWGELVSYEKGCFLGQEIVAKVHNLGEPPEKLVRIIFEKDPGNEARANGKTYAITTKAFSPKYGKWLGFAKLSASVEQIERGEILDTT